MRGYRPGDDVRAMDWRATARLRKPQVRVYTEERDRPGLLVIDQCQSMFFGSRRRMKSVVAAEAAAVAAWRILSQDDRVGALVFNDSERVLLRPQRSPRAVGHLMREVVRYNRRLSVDPAQPDGPAALAAALEHAARAAHHDHLVCIVSDFTKLDAASERLLTRLAAHNDVLAIAVTDPIGRLLPRAGRLTFASHAGRVEVDASAARVRDRFRDRFDEAERAVRRVLRRLDVPLLHLTPQAPVLDQLRQQLGELVRGPR
ncbi:MAG: DUF58 domain-containing protein [Planctomycetota bacterium]